MSQQDYFRDYVRYFSGLGCQVRKIEFPPDGTIEERGLVLREQLRRFSREYPGDPFILIAHSQGGLDCRYALSTLKLENVGVLITIGTPHRGTPLADWIVRERVRRGAFYRLLKWGAGYDLDALSFAGEMTTGFVEKHSRAFDPPFITVPGAPRIRYASARGVCRRQCHWSLRVLARWIGLGEGDGVVQAESQAWGEDLGQFDLDHISEVAMDAEKAGERSRLLERIALFAHLK